MTAPAGLATLWSAAGQPGEPSVDLEGDGAFRSAFDVGDLAAASLAAAGAAVAELVEVATGHRPGVTVDRRLASLWFGTSIQPVGWTLPPSWDAVAGDYRAADGWIRLHTNAPHHRRAALSVLAAAPDREAVAAAVATWPADALEAAIVAASGCAATMRSTDAWAAHSQGRAVAAEPLLHLATHDPVANPKRDLDPARPLAGIRVLDLTRVLAGPTATRFLAAFGAEVLRIDPPFWDEPALEPEMTLGKRCATLDLRDPAGRDHLRDLLAGADILIHGYRPGALPGLGLGPDERRRLAPALIDVSLCAYGWTGPWAARRGFDSLVQMSSGIAEAGMRWAATAKPTPLPVQALDVATGYLLATAAIRALARRHRTGAGSTARASLARTALLLQPGPDHPPLPPPVDADWSPDTEQTALGPAQRLRPPLRIDGAPLRWAHPASPLHAGEPEWTPA